MAETLRRLIRRHEGWLLFPYPCPAGHNTIGAGHNLDVKPLTRLMADYLKAFGKITDEMAEELLTDDIIEATKNCKIVYPGFDSFDEVRRNALISFLFNVGIGTAKKFINTNKAIAARNWEAAAAGFKDSLWYKQVGARGVEIVKMIKEGI